MLSENWSFQMLETVCLKCINAAAHKSKVHKCFQSGLWNGDISIERKRALTWRSRSHCNLHNDGDEKAISEPWRGEATRFHLWMHTDGVYSLQLGWWGSDMEEVGWTSLKRRPSLDKEQTARAVLNRDSRECRLKSTSLLEFFPLQSSVWETELSG